jgi:alpha-ketoglutarate-dependent taurine dioxygenase
MTEEHRPGWTLERLAPFGVVVHSARSGAELSSVPIAELKEFVALHRVVIARGFAPLSGTELPEYCARLGELLDWDFGSVNELKQRPDTQNYLYTDRAVPFHWDGAFVGRVPHYIFFHCDVAPPAGSGGETLFCDAVRLLELAPPERKALWEKAVITYTTEKVVHYGGTFSSPLICEHPISGEPVLRYAEPVSDLNPVRLEVTGIHTAAHNELIDDLHRRLNDPSVCYAHPWVTNDVVIADNFALLHGRRAFDGNAGRHLRRVNIL